MPAIVLGAWAGWLKRYFGASWWVVPATVLGLMVTIAPFLFIAFVKWLEEQQLEDERRYHHSLVVASSGMSRIKELGMLCRLIVHIVNRTVKLTHTGLFLFDPHEQRFFLRAVRHQHMLPDEMTIEPNDPLVGLLEERKDVILLEELKHEIESSRFAGEQAAVSKVYSWMRSLEVKLVVPSFSSNSLIGFLVLGPKRSGQRYTMNDIAIFSGLASQATLAIENAIYFEQVRNQEAHMIQSEKLASLGQLAAGMAHEIHNPLTIISGEAQLYLERFKGENARVDDIMMSIVEECRRAADITRRILRFAKPSASDYTPVDLRSIMEETLVLAGYQVRLEKIDRQVKIPENLPKVKGNQNQLQEVLLNLILNACQAMGEKGGRLQLTASNGNSEVVLKVEDTGPGIAADRLRKIFDPFFTTKQTGTGLGLFVTQRIIQLHGGSIEVDSKEGKGTCFTIRLPVFRVGELHPVEG